ncbi:MAG: VWA domain-containing protein [Kiritimatiellae bacterium]|nr:VWA domain-containing protein [Kiritimatiellia bacterium]
MKRYTDNIDLILLAMVISIALHAGLMFFAAPHVMSRVGAVAIGEKQKNRQPMKVRRFDADPLLESSKTIPKSDVPAPKSAPSANAVDAGSVPPSVSPGQFHAAAPQMPMPEVLSGPAEAVFELPKPAALKAEFTAESVSEMPIGIPPPAGMHSSFSSSASNDSIMPTPGLPAPAPEFSMPKIDERIEKSGMAGVAQSKPAPKVDYVFDNKVLDSVNEGFVEKEKAAVKALLSDPDAASVESAVDCEASACIDPSDPRWRYFKLKFTLKTGPDALPVVPKDAVILIDASGSIGSDRLRRCRNAAKEILRSCFNSGDRFNLVAFRNRFSYAFREWRECDAPSFEEADRWLSRLTAHGRTDVFSVIRSVLTLPRDPARPLIALVITDGDANYGVSDTAEILSRFTALNDGLVSVYMYGVKKEANRELIDLLTRGNRGESIIHTGDRRYTGVALEPLAVAFRDPVLTDMRIMFAAGTMAETYPRLLKNLYKGGDVVLRGRCPARVKELVFTLKGLSGSKAFESLYDIDLSTAKPAPASVIEEWQADRIVTGRLLR